MKSIRIDDVYENIKIGKYVIMPNRIRMIMCITNNNEEAALIISSVINRFKGAVVKKDWISYMAKFNCVSVLGIYRCKSH